MTDKEKQAKNKYQKTCYKKLKAYKDELLLKKQKKVKFAAKYCKKKRKECKNMSKIKMKKITNNLNGNNNFFV